MRQTRKQYHNRLALRGKKIGFDEALARVKREIKRRAIADGVIEDPSQRKPRAEWNWCLEDKDGTVFADTRSEARNLIKKALGVRKLPPDIIIVKVGPHAQGANPS